MLNERVRQVETGAFWQLLGIYVRFAEGGKAQVEMPIETKHLQIYGKVHGGVLATLIDNAIGAAVHSLLSEFEATATVDLAIKYAKAVAEGRLRAEAEILKRGKSNIFGQCSVYNEADELIAWGNATFAVLDRSRWQR
ncbi:MAG: PaaI family thioesterase [Deinococcales bacterium]